MTDAHQLPPEAEVIAPVNGQAYTAAQLDLVLQALYDRAIYEQTSFAGEGWEQAWGWVEDEITRLLKEHS